MAAKRTVILGVTGSIAAYKSADLASKLKKLGHDVFCVMTRDATHFITPLTLQTLSQHPVMLDLFEEATILFALIAAALPPALAAQSKGVELGLDGGFSYKVNSPTSLELALPFQRFRVGFTAGRMVSIEPSAVFDY